MAYGMTFAFSPIFFGIGFALTPQQFAFFNRGVYQQILCQKKSMLANVMPYCGGEG